MAGSSAVSLSSAGRIAARLGGLCALAVLANPADDAGAYSAQGHSWPQSASPVHYRLHADGAPGVADGSDLEAVRTAFSTWQSVSCSWLAFREEPWMDPRTLGNDGANRIFWVTDRAEWPGEAATLALTYTFFRLTDKVVTDADIISNGVDWQWATAETEVTGRTVDVETVMFHEIGHFFGLDHSQDPTAVMYAQNNEPIRRSARDDDLLGICTLYGNGNPIPQGGGGGSSDRGPVGAPCRDNGDCASSACLQDQDLGRTYCTAACSLADPASCPAGFPCTRTGQGEYCLAPVVVDELCDQCSQGSQCTSGLCVNVPGYNYFQPFCTRACDPTSGLPGQCPESYHCEAVATAGQTGGVCAPTTGVCNPQGRGGHNEQCYANGGCKSGHTCITYSQASGLQFCFLQCPAEYVGRSCSDTIRMSCQRIDQVLAGGRMNIAACLTIASAGQPCIPEVCEAGSTCAWDEVAGLESALCYAQCPTGQCPTNTQCRQFPGLPNLCIPNAGYKYLGDHCASDAECESRTCRVYGDKQLCTKSCATTDPTSCPSGMRCLAPTGSNTGLCWPASTLAPDTDEPVRTVQTSVEYCACDTTNECDEDCECDKECDEGGACSCSAAGDPGAPTALALLAACALLLLRRRRI